MLNRVIAFIRTMMGGVTPTQPAGHALQEPTAQAGKVSSASDTSLQLKSASKSRKRKPSAVQSTKAVKSRKPVSKPAQTTSGKRGSQQAIPVPQTQSPAPTKRKPKTEVAPSTTAVAKHGKKRPTARQVAMVNQSKPIGSKSKTPASKTRQHAK